jgi:hypothetical protein
VSGPRTLGQSMPPRFGGRPPPRKRALDPSGAPEWMLRLGPEKLKKLQQLRDEEALHSSALHGEQTQRPLLVEAEEPAQEAVEEPGARREELAQAVLHHLGRCLPAALEDVLPKLVELLGPEVRSDGVRGFVLEVVRERLALSTTPPTPPRVANNEAADQA